MTLKTYKKEQKIDRTHINEILSAASPVESEKTENREPATSNLSQKKIHRNIKHMFAMSQKDPDEKTIERLAQELHEWSLNETALNIEAFCVEKFILFGKFMSWPARYPLLEYSLEMARARIGVRREELALFKNSGINAPAITHTLHLYNEDWKEVREEQTKKLRNNESL